MQQSFKKFLKSFTTTTPFILSNTLIIVPYLLFLQLSDGASWGSIMPFLFFYSFRFTGLFLIRGLNSTVEGFTLLMAALLFGGLGSFLGLLGMFFPVVYSLAAIFLGLSASWFSPANITVNLQEKKQGFANMTPKKYPFALVLLAIVFWLLQLELPVSMMVSLVLGFYGLFYVAAYHTIRHYPNFEINFLDTSKNFVARRELLTFGLFFVLLVFLRGGRLLFNATAIDIAVLVFLTAFVFGVWGLSRHKVTWCLKSWLNVFNFVNGMLGDFLFLFLSLYVTGIKGSSALVKEVYLPYIIGMVLALVLGQQFLKSLPQISIMKKLCGGLVISLWLLLIPEIFFLGFISLSFFKNAASTWLNHNYFAEETLPEGQRILAKFSGQNKGSLSLQFLLMALLAFLAALFGEQPLAFLKIVTGVQLTDGGRQILTTALLVLIIFLSGCLITAYVLWRQSEKLDTDKK